jgi:aminomethyltransferase
MCAGEAPQSHGPSMTESIITPPQSLKRTPLYDTHVKLGARMVGFAGYEMPVQYPSGVLAEHRWTREHASLFDISHMGQAVLRSSDELPESVAKALEGMVPGDLQGLRPGQQRYTQILNSAGGVIDDLMVTRPDVNQDDGALILIVNASRKDVDYAVISSQLPPSVRLEPKPDLALLALQGPASAEVLAQYSPQAALLNFMYASRAKIANFDCHVSRSGYTGEDGFEISVAAKDVEGLWQTLSSSPEVRPCGLGARDSLRLEAGLCLYGHELDETTSPAEANISWSIQKRRRNEGGFPGSERVQRELREGIQRQRVGILPEGRAPARDGTEIVSSTGRKIGIVTSGGFSPTLNRPIAMGYVTSDHAQAGTRVALMVRGSALDAHIVDMPFVPHNYRRRS